MSSDGATELPPYIIPVEGKSDGVTVYHVHTPFSGNMPADDELPSVQAHSATPVYTKGGGGLGTGGVPATTADGMNRYVSYEMELGRSPGMTSCSSCQQQVMTNVTYKAGTYAWLMVLLFICCGLICCCFLIPLFVKKFKDCYHTCPRCNRVLYVDKKQCCKRE